MVNVCRSLVEVLVRGLMDLGVQGTDMYFSSLDPNKDTLNLALTGIAWTAAIKTFTISPSEANPGVELIHGKLS